MNRSRRRLVLSWCVLLSTTGWTPGVLRAADAPTAPLHRRIDRLIESKVVAPPAALAGDAEFLRRVSLDLTGMPPSPEELRTFLADSSTEKEKRVKAVDRLLESPLHARHLASILDVMLMERRPNQNVNADDWRNYLLKAVRENRPLNQVLKEILVADGADANLRPAGRFYLDRGSDPNLITRDVGRIFFGRDLQCAQCHDHPLIDDYQQTDYHGLLAFYSPGYLLTVKEGGKDKTLYAEKAGADLTFDSVFVKGDKHLTGPRVPGGTEVVEPVFPPGEEYRVKPAGQVPPVPKFSRRAQIASLATGGGNQAFNENMANRLWAIVMGRGLVHPSDMHHPSNPPFSPELLKLLGDELVALKFDVRAFLRELVLTEAYQRAIDLPEDRAPLSGQVATDLAGLKKQIDALGATADASRKTYRLAVDAWHAAETALFPATAERDQAMAKHAAAAKKQDDAQKAVTAILAKLTARQDVSKALVEAASKAQEAAKKLPAEKDLAAAAQKFVDRSAAVTKELTALQKTSDEKSVALKKGVEEVTAAALVVETARAKVVPLRDVVRRKEQDVLVTRQKMAETRVVVESHKKRLDLLEAYAHRKSLEEQAATAERSVAARRETLSQARKLLKEYADVLAPRGEEVKATEKVRLAAEKSRNDAKAALDRQQKIVTSVTGAFHATDAALQELPDDPALIEAAEKLKSKAAELRSASESLKSRLDAAALVLKTASDKLATANRAFDSAKAEEARRTGEVKTARTALTVEESRVKALASEIASATDQLVTLLGNDFAVAQLKPLSPEQLCWSLMKVTGVYDRQRQAEEAELNKAKPLTEAAKNDPAQLRAREADIEQRAFDKLKGTVPAFVKVYAAAAGQPQNDFFATADQALFAANGGLINGWLAPAGGNLSERMVKEKDPPKAADDLYVTVLSRTPSAEEVADVVRLLAENDKNKPAAVQELVWGLLTSAEFRFNH
jgi:hypothetical protein